MRVFLLRPCKVGAAPPAARSQSVAQCAVDAEFVFSCLGRLDVSSEWIPIIRSQQDVQCGSEGDDRADACSQAPHGGRFYRMNAWKWQSRSGHYGSEQ